MTRQSHSILLSSLTLAVATHLSPAESRERLFEALLPAAAEANEDGGAILRMQVGQQKLHELQAEMIQDVEGSRGNPAYTRMR